MLKERVLTGLILAPLFLAMVILLPTEAVSMILALVIMLAGWEWTRLACLSSVQSLLFYLLLAAGMYGLYCHPELLKLDQWLLWASLLWWSGIAVVILRYEPRQVDNDDPVVRLSKGLMGLICLLPAWWALSQLHNYGGHGVAYFLFTFFIVWAADIGAYFAGKRFGKRKLAPNVSPGKTIEGLLGGLLSVAVLSIVAGLWFEFEGTKLLLFIVLTVAVAGYSVFGDLFESLMKRQAGIKDSSNLLPGHGGILDRIDSVLAAAPLFLFGLLTLI